MSLAAFRRASMIGARSSKSVAKSSPAVIPAASFTTSKPKADKIESEIKEYYTKASHYQKIWGARMHIGFYASIADPSLPKTSWDDAVVELTHRMCDSCDIDKNSRVIDFGCGVGENVFDIAERYNCAMNAVIDITEDYIKRANDEAADRGREHDCRFFAGSILDLPQSVKDCGPFTHVFSQECIYHVANHFEDAVKSAGDILESGGLFANCDFFKSDNDASEKMQKHFFHRLKLDALVSMTECCEIMTANGFDIVRVEDWSDHAVQGYKDLQEGAERAKTVSDDGVPLAEHYHQTWQLFHARELLMPYVIARKR